MQDRPFNEWLETTIKYLYEHDVLSIGFVAIQDDGDVVTAYYNSNATDKAVMSHNIYADSLMDIVCANADMIKQSMEDLDEE